jgi:hypothetical protein
MAAPRVESDASYDEMKLGELFDKAWLTQYELYKSTNESGEHYEQERKRLIQMLTKCESMLDELHLFSENESLEEVATNELR